MSSDPPPPPPPPLSSSSSFDAPPPKVSKDLANAVQDDWRRQVQDDAKHRAVRQMEGYDVFKNMVSVAHLRPYHAENLRDHGGGVPPAFAFDADGKHAGPPPTPGSGGAASLSGGGGGGGGGGGAVAFTPPTNALAFDKTWRRECKTIEQRWRYLGGVDAAKLREIFKVEITGVTLGDVLVALSEGYAESAKGGGACAPWGEEEDGGGGNGGGGGGGGGGGETAFHTTPFAWCTPFLKDFSRRHSSPALPFQRLTGKTFD